MALVDNLISAWELDEASGNAVDSHGANTLTETNGPIAAGGGGGRDFESTSSNYFTISDNASLSTGDIDFTLEAWVNMESNGSRMEVLGKLSGGTFEYGLEYNQSVDRFRFLAGNGSTTGIAVADNLGSPSIATLYQLFGWHDSVNNVVGIAVNAGTANTSAHTVGAFDSTYPFSIGQAGDLGSLFFDGIIRRVRFWKRVLTGAERTELYNGGTGRSYSYINGGGGGTPAMVAARPNRVRTLLRM